VTDDDLKFLSTLKRKLINLKFSFIVASCLLTQIPFWEVVPFLDRGFFFGKSNGADCKLQLELKLRATTIATCHDRNRKKLDQPLDAEFDKES